RSYVFHPILWSRRTLAAALARAGFVDIVIANSAPTSGDPYGVGGRRETAVQASKWILARAARAVDRMSGGAWLIGAPMTAVARKPGLCCSTAGRPGEAWSHSPSPCSRWRRRRPHWSVWPP